MGVAKVLNIPTKLKNNDNTLSDIKCHYAVDLYDTPPSTKYLTVVNGQNTYYACVKDLNSQDILNRRETGISFDNSTFFAGAAGAFRGDASCGIMCSVNDRVPSVKYANTSRTSNNSYTYTIDPASSKDALGWFIALKNCLTWQVPAYYFEKRGSIDRRVFLFRYYCTFSSSAKVTYTDNTSNPNQQLFIFLPVFENKVEVTVSFLNASDADLKQIVGADYDTWRSSKTTSGPQTLGVYKMVTASSGNYEKSDYEDLTALGLQYSYFPTETPFYGSNISKVNISIKEVSSGNTWSRTFYVCPPGIKQGTHTITLKCTGADAFTKTWSGVAFAKEITPSHYLKSTNSFKEGSLASYNGFNLSEEDIKIGCFVRKT